MEKREFDEIIEKIKTKSTMTSQDIPDLDLYIDQIMTLFDQHLDNHKRYEDDKLLTKTMINNYSKAKVLSPVKGKKYTKDQIIQMLMIYYLKNTLTIQEIKKVLTPLYDQDVSLSKTYDQFIDIQESINQSIIPYILHKVEEFNLDMTKDDNRLVLMMILSSLSQSLSGIVEYMADQIEE